MLNNIKNYVGKGASFVAAAVMFVVMLPITFGVMLVMVFAGMITLATVRHRMRKAGVSVNWPASSDRHGSESAQDNQREPIEGSYTVVQK